MTDEKDPTAGLPESKPCTADPGPNDMICPQGMVLSHDPYDPSGRSLPDLPIAPVWVYRCQDCDHVEPVEPKETTDAVR